MAETHHIAEMAAQLARKLFKNFYWEEIKPSDQNWACVMLDEHGRNRSKTHPTDAVYRYIHPYSGNPTYIVFDFKSLAEKSIQPAKMGDAIRSLAMTIDCAMVSEEWQKLYLRESAYDLEGALFVYNHDDTYKKILYRQIDNNINLNYPLNWPALKKNHEVIIIDPLTIKFVNSFCQDMAVLTGEGNLPKIEDRGFYQPDKQLKSHKIASSSHYQVPLMPDQLSSDTIFVRYKIDQTRDDSGKSGFLIYYRGTGEDIEEFIYLFDNLFTYQIIDNASEIKLKLCFPDKFSPNNFEKAKEQYSLYASGTESNAELIKKRMDIISFKTFDQVTPQYLETELGMK